MKQDPNKWLGRDYHFEKPRNAATEAAYDYARALFDSRQDVTKGEALKEFWERMAEYNGFTIVWPTPEKSE